MGALDLDAILSGAPPRRRGRTRHFPAEIAKERAAERNRRTAKAQQWAKQALSRIHKDEYDELYRQGVARANRVFGPLPGDEVVA